MRFYRLSHPATRVAAPPASFSSPTLAHPTDSGLCSTSLSPQGVSADPLPLRPHSGLDPHTSDDCDFTIENPHAAAYYRALRTEDPHVDLPWFLSVLIFGVSPPNDDDPRYQALSKLKAVLADHGVDKLRWSDFRLAFSLYAAKVDRDAKHYLRKDSHPSHSSARFPVFPVKPDFPRHPPNLRPSLSADSSRSLPSRRPREEPTTRVFSRSSSQILLPRVTRASSLPSEVLRTLLLAPPLVASCEPSSEPHSARLHHSSSSTSTQSASSPLVSPVVPSSPHAPAWQLHLLYHVLRHADSIYGLPITLASTPRVSLTHVTDRAIIRRRTGVRMEDLLLTNFATGPFLPAFYVAIDRALRAIVVCVRGTANLGDILTDVAAKHDQLTVRRHARGNEFGRGGRMRAGVDVGVSRGSSQRSQRKGQSTLRNDNENSSEYISGQGHGGVLRSALEVYGRVSPILIQATREHPTFALLVTGHSLGAATAGVLALLLRDDPDLPRATAVCIAPPPCLTHELAEQTAGVGITLVNGPDIVPQLSVTVLLPLFATAAYVARLSWKRKAFLSLGMKRAIINWGELDEFWNRRVEELKLLHEGQVLFIPGRVLQLVRREERRRRDGVRKAVTRTREVDAVHVSKWKFLRVRSRERRMFMAHAPFSYRTSLALALRTLHEKPLALHEVAGYVDSLTEDMSSSNLWAGMCDSSVPIVTGSAT